ncbi:7TM diverse intracellular signaling domain-containing protein [uncultured Microscilla sp.]|uniref:7TM diverse intracellular signaling domain-containing protein n=1 Tax=uncultured Microscilla sp. TaxID=432653 RepID=UPI00262B2CA4|nr:7TM diverse intracellular signaling domain-containing protein [uncultured Microscilla sp.]
MLFLKNKSKDYRFSSTLVLLLWLGLHTTYGQSTIVITQTQQMQLIGKQVLYYEDTTARLNLEDVRQPRVQQQFKPLNKDIFNQEPSQSVLWFKLIVQNKTGQDLWLETGDSFAYYIDFYRPNAEGKYTSPIKLGVLRPKENKLVASNFYYVPLSKSDSVQTYYLRKAGDFTHYHVFQAGTPQALHKHIKVYDYILAGFLGVILSLALYNLMLFYSTKDKIYLIYVVYLLYSFVNVPFNNGYALFEGSFWWQYFYVWSNPIFIVISLFVIHYLQLSIIAPRLCRWIQAITILLSGIFPLLNLFHYPHFVHTVMPYQLILMVYMCSLLGAGVYVWYQGFKNARFYVMGWFFAIASVFIHILALEGILPSHQLFHHSIYIGVSLEALLFALALGDRWNLLKKEKEVVQAENLRLVEQQNNLLAQKVEEKTKELQLAYEEVQTNNDALKITQEVVASRNELLAAQNDELSLYRTRIGQSFRAAQMIQVALLPPSESMTMAFADYFVFNRPKDVVSGDFYWLYTYKQTKVLVVADCTGHGVPGAFMTFIGNNLLDKIIKINGVTQPSKILSALNREVQMVFQQQGATKGYEGGMDAAVVAFTALPNQTTEVIFAGAKSNLWYISSPQHTLHEITGTRRSVGGFQPKGKKPYQTHRIELPPHSLLYLGSDGLPDQNNEQRHKFGSAQLKNILLQNAHLTLQVQKQRLAQALQQHMQDTEQRDDILWVGVKL